MSPTALDDPQEFGRRVRAARGYVGLAKPKFGDLMGKKVSTITRWEKGDLGKTKNSPLARRQLAEQIVANTDCPPKLFDLDEVATGSDVNARLDDLEVVVRRLLHWAIQESEPDLDEIGDAAVRLFGPNNEIPARSKPGAENA